MGRASANTGSWMCSEGNSCVWPGLSLILKSQMRELKGGQEIQLASRSLAWRGLLPGTLQPRWAPAWQS